MTGCNRWSDGDSGFNEDYPWKTAANLAKPVEITYNHPDKSTYENMQLLIEEYVCDLCDGDGFVDIDEEEYDEETEMVWVTGFAVVPCTRCNGQGFEEYTDFVKHLISLLPN